MKFRVILLYTAGLRPRQQEVSLPKKEESPLDGLHRNPNIKTRLSSVCVCVCRISPPSLPCLYSSSVSDKFLFLSLQTERKSLFLLFLPCLPPPPPPFHSLKSQQTQFVLKQHKQTLIGLRGWWLQTLWLSSQGYKRMSQPENQFV